MKPITKWQTTDGAVFDSVQQAQQHLLDAYANQVTTLRYDIEPLASVSLAKLHTWIRCEATRAKFEKLFAIADELKQANSKESDDE